MAHVKMVELHAPGTVSARLAQPVSHNNVSTASPGDPRDVLLVVAFVDRRALNIHNSVIN